MSAPQRGVTRQKVEHTPTRAGTRTLCARRKVFRRQHTQKTNPILTQNLRVDTYIKQYLLPVSRECSIRLRADHSTTMPLDVSPTATADIRMGVGPAGRAPQTVMQVRAPPSEAHLCAPFSRSDSATPRGRTNNAPPPRGPEPATRRVESGGVPRRLVDFRYVSARERLRRGRLPRDARDPRVERAFDRRIRRSAIATDRRFPLAPPGLQEVLRAQALQHAGPERCVSRPRRLRGDCTRAVERGLPTASSVAHVSRHLGAKFVAQGASCVRAPPGERGDFFDGVSEDFISS